MSHGNSARLKHPKKGETLDLDDQNKKKGISRSQHGNVDLQLSHLDSNLALDLNPDLGLGLLQKHANFADVMNRYGYNSINEFDDLKAVTRKEYPPRSHPTDGGDDEMAHRLGGRLESRRSLSTVRDLSAGNDEKASWVNDCEFLETNQRQKYAHVDNILNVPLPDLVSYSGGNNMSTWSNRKSRLKPAKSPEETFQLDDLDEEPDCQTEESNDRQSRSTNVALRPSLKMRPRSEPPHLRLPGNEQNFLEHYQGSDKLKSQLWHIQVPEETAYGIESRISRPSCDVSPPVCPSWEGSQRKGKTSERKKRKLSPKDKKVEKKEIKTKVISDKIDRLKLSKNNRTQPRRKKSFSPPSLQRYSPPTKDNTPFKRTSKTFPEMRAINQVINEDMQEKKKAEEGDTTKPMDSPPPCYKSYSPSSSKKNLSSRRSPSPRQSVKKTENPKSSSPQRNMPKRNQLTPTKIPPSDIKAEGDVSSTMCYPSYSPSYYNTSRRSPSKTSVKALRRSNDEGKTQTKQQSPSSRPKSPKKGKTQSLKSASKENCVASPCARSRSRQASPASSKTHFLSKCSPPFRSTSKIYPDPKLKRSPSLSKTASKTSVKPVSPGVKREPSWGSLAITAMPLQPSFLPTFYEDLRASPPSPRINSTSPSQFCTDGSALWQHGYPKTESPSPKRNSDKRGTFSNEGVVPSTSGLHQKSPPRHARTNSGMHKTGKRGKRSRKDKNENKRHKAKKRSSKVDASDMKADSRGETCTPSYHPCRESPEFVSKADTSPPKSNEVTPGKGQTAAVSRPSRSRLGVLCRKSSPKGKLNLRWPSPCHRRCGQSMPRLGVLTRIGQAFGSQLRTIANNRFPFPGITPLYVSDAGPEESLK